MSSAARGGVLAVRNKAGARGAARNQKRKRQSSSASSIANAGGRKMPPGMFAGTAWLRRCGGGPKPKRTCARDVDTTEDQHAPIDTTPASQHLH
jgi:hypothetical protein